MFGSRDVRVPHGGTYGGTDRRVEKELYHRSSGKDVTKVDSIKIAKALKHFLAAVSLQPLNRQLYMHIGRLFYDSCVSSIVGV